MDSRNYEPIDPHSDSLSLHSNAPLASNAAPTAGSYPPVPPMPPQAQRQVRVQDYAEKPQGTTIPMPDAQTGGSSASSTPGGSRSASRSGHIPRNSSWDLLAGIRRFENDYEGFDTRHATEAHLAFAEGDVPDNKFSKLYHYLLNASVITRWTLFILPVLALIWIPGILSFTAFPKATVWGVRLRWWSIWLSVVWGGWWICLAGARILPAIARNTIGLVAVGSRKYIEWLDVLQRYVAGTAWSLANWITFQPLIDNVQESDASSGSRRATDTFAKILFAIFLCFAILSFEKFAIQFIAGKFHEKSYAERIQAQKFAIQTLTTLYRHSRDIPGRSDTMRDGPGAGSKRPLSVNPKQFFRKALKGVRFAATTTTTALGNVASEIAGSSVLQPNSPQAMVQTAIHSANKSRLLARRLFYSFAQGKSEVLLPSDINGFFASRDQADAAFALFDKDANGDASRDEVEMACMEIHREQLSIEHSMRDLDSAVGRLDNILMTIYFFICIILTAVVLDTELVTLVTGAGTLILGLSWLIGSSLAEVLTSIIFLFIKHPYDVGDRVDLGKDSYTVKEIRLLSTIFIDSHGTLVQAPNTVINGMFVLNIRRSPQMSEPFSFDVAYDTTFEQLEDLRERMLRFLQKERRDYMPSFDVHVIDIPDQEKMSLKADIKYKSNWQQGAIKAKRRNKWVCALKVALREAGIFGPTGNPETGPAPPTKYTLVPWDEVRNEERKHAAEHPHHSMPERQPTDGWNLTDGNMFLNNGPDVFDEGDELRMANPSRGARSLPPSRSVTVPMPAAITMPTGPVTPSDRGAEDDYIEMNPRTPRAATFNGRT